MFESRSLIRLLSFVNIFLSSRKLEILLLQPAKHAGPLPTLTGRTRRTADAIRAEEGNLRYDYFFSESDPETVLLIDNGASQEDVPTTGETFTENSY